jgi:hypothetical protein
VSDDGKMIKPNFKIARDTIILRDIPSATPEDEVRSIFEGENMGTVLAVWFAVLDWSLFVCTILTHVCPIGCENPQ